jgi:hypothetical protein
VYLVLLVRLLAEWRVLPLDRFLPVLVHFSSHIEWRNLAVRLVYRYTYALVLDPSLFLGFYYTIYQLFIS